MRKYLQFQELKELSPLHQIIFLFQPGIIKLVQLNRRGKINVGYDYQFKIVSNQR